MSIVGWQQRGIPGAKTLLKLKGNAYDDLHINFASIWPNFFRFDSTFPYLSYIDHITATIKSLAFQHWRKKLNCINSKWQANPPTRNLEYVKEIIQHGMRQVSATKFYPKLDFLDSPVNTRINAIKLIAFLISFSLMVSLGCPVHEVGFFLVGKYPISSPFITTSCDCSPLGFAVSCF